MIIKNGSSGRELSDASMLGSVITESSDSGNNHSIEGYAGDVSSEGKVSSTSLCVDFKNMEIAGTEDEIVHVVGYGVVGDERIVKREDMWEYVDDCIVMGEGVERSIAPGTEVDDCIVMDEGVERSIAPEAAVSFAAHDDPKEDVGILEECKEETGGSPGSRLDDDGGQYQYPSNGRRSNAKLNYQESYLAGGNGAGSGR